MRDTRPLQSARLKVDHARWHLDRVRVAVDQYVASRPYRLSLNSRFEPQRHFLLQIDGVPDEIPLAIGDCLGAMRCALDHVAWALANGKGTQDTKFPIAQAERRPSGKAAERFTTEKCKLNYGKPTKGLSSPAVDFVRTCNPQPSDPRWRDHPLVVMNTLVQADKHQMLRTAGVSVSEVHVFARHIAVSGGGEISNIGFQMPIPEGAEVISDGGRVQVPLLAAPRGSAIDFDVDTEASIEVRATDRPSEEIGRMLFCCHEAVEAIVTEAESRWTELVTSRY